jgi:muramoyltetrapeptide carboxypeptidase
MRLPLIKPLALKEGDVVGIFTPSAPANVLFREKYLHGIRELERIGLKVVEGPLTSKVIRDGYRSGSPHERADEFMHLIRDEKVRGLVSAIGGMNSGSMLPYLNFEEIRSSRKVICGYSDVTALHMAILSVSGLSTFYGPAVMPSFGEWPHVLEDTMTSFWRAVASHCEGKRGISPPARFSVQFRDAKTDAWKVVPREFQANVGWKVVSPGRASGPMIVANLNTLLTLAGTKFFPDVEGSILVIEDMNAPLSQMERSLRQLDLMGCFSSINALVIGKPENYDQQGASFDLEGLIAEVVGNRSYPILSNFDCGHSVPMLTLAQGCYAWVGASKDGAIKFEVDSMVEKPNSEGSAQAAARSRPPVEPA